MALTPSTMLPLGTPAPAFTLPDVTTGRPLGLEDVRGPRGLLVMFICRHCPFVKHLQAPLTALANSFLDQGVGAVAISANNPVSHPQDAPELLAGQASELGFRFPYLFDGPQTTARAYAAACTPDFFLFDAGLRLVYRGQFDASRPGDGKPVTGADLRAALAALVGGAPVAAAQHPSIGCNIKWKPGMEPV